MAFKPDEGPGYGWILAIILIFGLATVVISSSVQQTIGPEEATRIALQNATVHNWIDTSPYEVHAPSRETVRKGDDPSQEVWNVQIWMEDKVEIIIVEITDTGEIWDIRTGHNPYVMERMMANAST